ncbi:MAG: alpha/beta hydrolase [Oscillospiraceae bacterium]|nr:alpha/beta hydrolase [Oscillospiraceae bacterium]
MQKDSQKFNSEPPKKPLFIPPMKVEQQDAPLPDDLTEIRQMAFKHVGDEVLYTEAVFPKQLPASGKLPVAIYFHGGGLISGNCGLCPVFRRNLAHLGHLVYSVDYRLIDKTDAHGLFSDACDAFAFIHRDMQQHHGDPDRVFVIGESAGAFVSRLAVAAALSRKLRVLYQLPDPLLRFRGVVFLAECSTLPGMIRWGWSTRRIPSGSIWLTGKICSIMIRTTRRSTGCCRRSI